MIFITHEKSIGRAGHQFKDAVTPLIIAEIFGFVFVYTDYKAIAPFNLGHGRLSRNNLPDGIPVHIVEGPFWKGVPYEKLMAEFSDLETQHQNQDCLVVLKNSFRVQLFQTYSWYRKGRLRDNIFDRVINTLRENFRIRNPQDLSAFNRDKTSIAVHIRRGDVANRKDRIPSSQHYAHDMDYYDSILTQLKSSLDDRELDIRIYTEHVSAEDVVAYCKESPDIALHQGGKAEFTDHFQKMVYSDILVVSNSSMSQMAGYLSRGLKIFHPNDQYHSLPEDEFVPVDELEKERILKYLNAKIVD
jgi:hypothetical protein